MFVKYPRGRARLQARVLVRDPVTWRSGGFVQTVASLSLFLLKLRGGGSPGGSDFEQMWLWRGWGWGLGSGAGHTSHSPMDTNVPITLEPPRGLLGGTPLLASEGVWGRTQVPSGCMTLGEGAHLSEPRFPDLLNGAVRLAEGSRGPPPVRVAEECHLWMKPNCGRPRGSEGPGKAPRSPWGRGNSSRGWGSFVGEGGRGEVPGVCSVPGFCVSQAVAPPGLCPWSRSSVWTHSFCPHDPRPPRHVPGPPGWAVGISLRRVEPGPVALVC